MTEDWGRNSHGRGMDPDEVEAGDPATSPERLHELASMRPDLHAVLAANPTLYDDLRSWLASRGDPQIDAALASNPAPGEAAPGQVTDQGGYPVRRSVLTAETSGAAQAEAHSHVDDATIRMPAPILPEEEYAEPPVQDFAREPAGPVEAPRRRRIWPIVLLVVVLAGLAIAISYLLGTRSDAPEPTGPAASASSANADDQDGSSSAQPSGAATSASPAPSASGEPTEGEQSQVDPAGFAYTVTGFDGRFSTVGSASAETSQPFVADVIAAYNDSGADGGAVSLSVFSEGANRVIDLTCEPESGRDAVRCVGGRTVDLLLYN